MRQGVMVQLGQVMCLIDSVGNVELRFKGNNRFDGMTPTDAGNLGLATSTAVRLFSEQEV